MERILLAIGAAAGLGITYIDSRPGWDDTGISAGLILLTTGLLALAGHRRPWLLALVVGGWITVRGLLVAHDPAAGLALVLALVGAYAGRLCRAAMTGGGEHS
ncbi:MAG: hypothetical protein R3D98_06340 [Candidatus Krumholzibacteriia bacterium]